MSFRLAGAGPMPMMRGGTPAMAPPRMREMGVRPCCFIAASEAMRRAAAPSFAPEALPAVTEPSGKRGSSFARASIVVARGRSSWSTLADAVARGGRLLTGGRRIGNEGWFFEPTVLADVPVSARIMNEEPFGPVAIVNRFSTLDEAIAEANRLPFALAAFAFTRSTATSTRLSAEVEAGMLSINHLGLALPEIPFGGMKESGYGTEGGSEALEAYLETRLVTRRE